MQTAWYTGEAFPEQYRGDAYVAMRGSWNRRPPSGYEVLRIDFENGQPAGLEPFITGFLMKDEESPSGWGHLGRLAGLAQGPDGALYLSDDTNGVVYRIVYADEGGSEAIGPEATNAETARTGILGGDSVAPPPESENALARGILAPEGARMDIASAAFDNAQPIPAIYATEQQNLSPPLDWAEGPEETQSYVAVVEDPDVTDNPPFVHWLVYDIPAEVTELREGVPGAPQLPLPKGAKQGSNDHGSTGWYGMRPPEGDPAHEYHFQVFALDTMLDLPHGASRAELLDAMQGHVLAAGEVVGTFER